MNLADTRINSQLFISLIFFPSLFLSCLYFNGEIPCLVRIGGRENFFHCYKCGKRRLLHNFSNLEYLHRFNTIEMLTMIFFFTIMKVAATRCFCKTAIHVWREQCTMIALFVLRLFNFFDFHLLGFLSIYCLMSKVIKSSYDFLQFLFESRYDVTVLPCGHTIHQKCLKEMRDHYQ